MREKTLQEAIQEVLQTADHEMQLQANQAVEKGDKEMNSTQNGTFPSNPNDDYYNKYHNIRRRLEGIQRANARNKQLLEEQTMRLDRVLKAYASLEGELKKEEEERKAKIDIDLINDPYAWDLLRKENENAMEWKRIAGVAWGLFSLVNKEALSLLPQEAQATLKELSELGIGEEEARDEG